MADMGQKETPIISSLSPLLQPPSRTSCSHDLCPPVCPPDDDISIRFKAKWSKYASAVREHVVDILGADEESTDRSSRTQWCVVVRDSDGVVLDVIGSPSIVAVLQWHGIAAGKSFPHHEVFIQAELKSIDTAVKTPEDVMLGSLHVFSRPEVDNSLLQALAKSIVRAAISEMEADWSLRDTSMMYQAVLSHLDYHVIRTLSGASTKSYHPIPLLDSVRQEMLQFTTDNADGSYELTLGDKLYSAVLCDLSYPDGSCAGKVGLFRDITQERKMELKIRDADRVNILASLAAGIAHEIRNPLTTAKGFLQLFGERQAGLPDRQYIDLTIQELDRIQQLVKDFMSLARPEVPRFQQLELNKVIEEVIQFMHPEAILRGVTLDSMPKQPTIMVKGDLNQLKQVLINVLQNALQACCDKGQVTVEASMRSSSAVIEIQDTGAGLRTEDLARVFQPFYTTKESGTGLGLAICRQIMNEHGGSIKLESEPGVGTTVTLQLPLAE